MTGKVTRIGQSHRHNSVKEVEINGRPYFTDKHLMLRTNDLVEYSNEGLVAINNNPLIFANIVRIEKIVRTEQVKEAAMKGIWLSSVFPPKKGSKIEIDGVPYEWLTILEVNKSDDYWIAKAETPDGSIVKLDSRRFRMYINLDESDEELPELKQIMMTDPMGVKDLPPSDEPVLRKAHVLDPRSAVIVRFA